MSAATPKASSANDSADTKANKSLDKDGVRKAFRSFASSLIVAARQAEKVASAGGGSDTTKVTAAPDNSVAGGKMAKGPLEEAVQMVLKQRLAVRRSTTLLEGKLRGNAKESEALHCCLRSQPCVGGRKRKFTYLNSQDNGKQP